MGDIGTNLKTETIRQKIRNKYLADATVTVVLIGSETQKRKHVNWDISSSIRKTENSSRSGLIGIVLPSYPRKDKTEYNPKTIPPRLHDNIERKFTSIHNWSDDSEVVQKWIHNAFLRRYKIEPDNSRDLFKDNRAESQISWKDQKFILVIPTKNIVIYVISSSTSAIVFLSAILQACRPLIGELRITAAAWSNQKTHGFLIMSLSIPNSAPLPFLSNSPNSTSCTKRFFIVGRAMVVIKALASKQYAS